MAFRWNRYSILSQTEKCSCGNSHNFNALEGYPLGQQVCDIIDNLQQTMPGTEVLDVSKISFIQYDFLGIISNREGSGNIETFSDIENDTTSTLENKLSRIVNAHNVRVSVLLQYLQSAGSDNLNVLNISIDWRIEFPEREFKSMLKPLRKCFESLSKQGCFCVCAAGNDGVALDADLKAKSQCKSLFVTLANETQFRKNMIVAGASGVFGQYCSFSNYGSQLVHLAAPGRNVLLPEGYEIDGTSFSAPLISALIAVILQVFPQLSHNNLSQVIPRIVNTLDPLTSSSADRELSITCRQRGRINPSRTLRKELIGLYGILNEEDLPDEYVDSVLAYEEMLQEAVELELESIRLRDLSLMGYSYWGLICSKLSEEIAVYNSLIVQLQSITFVNDTAIAWQKFELGALAI